MIGHLMREPIQLHTWLIDHFDEIESGAVVDVEFILGEKPAPKVSEREEAYT